MLKWIGNKQRSAFAIASVLPNRYSMYYEPFVGSGAVLASMAPTNAIAGDSLKPLIELWVLIRDEPQRVLDHYRHEWNRYIENRTTVYSEVLSRFNSSPNPLDLLFLCRTCYGGVVRFTKLGQMSTPLGPHRAIPPEALDLRLKSWTPLIQGTDFRHASYEETIADAAEGAVIYCDPPYSFSQAILYGAQQFDINQLWRVLVEAKGRGARIAVSIDGSKHTGATVFEHAWPSDLFERELSVDLGGSMLKRFQLSDDDTVEHAVSDRLLLSW